MKVVFANATINTNTKREKLKLDDSTLIGRVREAEGFISKRKNLLEMITLSSSKNNYLDLKLAKLAYNFAREEYDNLSIEAVSRGLIII